MIGYVCEYLEKIFDGSVKTANEKEIKVVKKDNSTNKKEKKTSTLGKTK